ncbi:MAG: ATP-dependent DNA helicase RecG [Deltaproteobacteria bacterium]|nr:MAG: ATP-dependent DNA helicase RecG [Deltaproteobacteria bacterium]
MKGLKTERINNNLNELNTSIQYVKGVGPKVAKILRKKGIEKVEDALYFLPRAYEDRRQIKKIAELEVEKKQTICGKILFLEVSRRRQRKLFTMVVGDESGTVTAKWFHFNHPYMSNRHKIGQRIILSGEVKSFNYRLEFHHPDLELVTDEEDLTKDNLNFGRVVPIYSEPDGLYQKSLRRIMWNAVEKFADCLSTGIPYDIRQRYNLLELSEAARRAHFPSDKDDINQYLTRHSQAQRTLIFDEFFFLELSLALRRRSVVSEEGYSFEIKHDYTERLREMLPFQLTGAQQRVLKEIEGDMNSPHPMHRLLQGDVGSGKTIVALMAALIAVDNGYQVAIMAPTEILAEQHFYRLNNWAKALGVKTTLLTSSISKKDKSGIYQGIKSGEIDLVVGTHAIIQEGVDFHRLGLGIIDEQHRFGVLQRAELKRKGANPDVLVMTATPIPRTLAMTVYGDLDVSVIDELPPGRAPVKTRVYWESRRARVYEIVRQEVSKGSQAYIVYPLVEESEKVDLKDATRMAGYLQNEVFPELNIGLIHGRMKGEDKVKVMQDFKDRRIDILVATTVIEVGIDVINATVMVVENAERFGLSQLHQLRGRVRRGTQDAICLLLAKYLRDEDSQRRLRIMEETDDGFRIAEEDLAIRGPGEFLGTRQSGLPDFRVANIIRDADVLSQARKEAFNLIREHPDLELPEYQALMAVLKHRQEGRLELATIG